jgi:hypothetical protein
MQFSRALSSHAVANTWWDPSTLPSWLDEKCYLEQIQPLLKTKKVREIAAAINVSELYAGFIRLGRRRPHPRHWDALCKLVEVSPIVRDRPGQATAVLRLARLFPRFLVQP